MMKLELTTRQRIRVRGIVFTFSDTERLWVRLSGIDLADEKTLKTLRLVQQYHLNIVAHFYLTQVRDDLREALKEKERLGWSYYRVYRRIAPGLASEYETLEQITQLREIVTLAQDQPFFTFDETLTEIPEQMEGFVQEYKIHEEQQRRIGLARKFPDEHKGFVYLFKLSTGHYKIGLSIDREKRGRSIVSGLPLTIELIHQIASNQIACLESELHEQYRLKRLYKRHGERSTETEWFSLDTIEVDEIKAITERKYEWVNNPEWEEIIKPPMPPTVIPLSPNENAAKVDNNVSEEE